MAIYTVLTTMGGLIGTTALGFIQKSMVAHGVEGDISLYGNSLAAFVALGYLGSVPLYWKAGQKYEA